MRKFKPLLLFIPLLLSLIVSSQVRTNFNNQALLTSKGQFLREYKPQVDFELPARNINDLLDAEKAERLLSDEVKPFRLAVPVAVDLNIAQLTSWVTDNEYAYGKYTIRLNGALSGSINFDKFYLPKGTEMYVYNENGNMITGPVTENENNDNHTWGSWVYRGPFITIEIKTPLVTKDQVRLHANNIAYGYKEIYRSVKTGGFGLAGDCEINVICPLGNGWEAERNSVATILSATGAEFCTGSLVMNTCGNNRPFFLTANHCWDANSNTWRFNFQAWSTTCPNPGTNAGGVLYNGSIFRARNDASDFCLVELTTTPPANSGINYAGWSRSTNPAQNATAIHHPRGDVMKISRSNNPVVVGSWNQFINTHWQSTWSPQVNGLGNTVTPVTEPGSSGSPLFDQDHRVVGQLHGGPSACGNGTPWDFYGRFDLSWTGGGTSATRLSDWLDQAGSGAMTTNTTNISALPVPIGALSITGSSAFCSGTQQYTLNGAPAGANITWQTSSGIATITPTGNPATLTKVYNGTVTITASVAGCNGMASATKTVVLGAPVSITSTQNGCSGDYQQWFLNAGPSGNAGNWNWTVGYVGTNSYINISNPSSPGTWVSVKGGGTVSLTYTDICGVAHTDGVTVYSTCHTFRIAVSPNPAKDNINLSLNPITDKETASGQTQAAPLRILKSKGKTIISLYDMYTRTMVKQWIYNESKNQNYALPVSGLSKGVYVMQVDREDQTKVTEIIIE